MRPTPVTLVALLVASCTTGSDDSDAVADAPDSTDAAAEQVPLATTDAPASTESTSTESPSTESPSTEVISTETISTEVTSAEPAATEPETTPSESTPDDDVDTANTEPVESSACVSMQISFDEGAPRDRFSIVNLPDSADVDSVVLDLSGSAGMLVFDTLPGGDGVEVFQDFVDEGGDATLASAPTLSDGDESLTLAFSSFEPGASFEFSLDVDDRLTDSELGQIQVADGEIEGAELTVIAADGAVRIVAFGADSTASLTC